MRTRRAGAALFDVDDTLITAKSIFSFLLYLEQVWDVRRPGYRRARHALRTLVESGASRDQVLRTYFRLYEGQQEADTADHGKQWFAEQLRSGNFVNPHAVAAFRRHTAAGHLTVLVSGSFPACLDPLARFLDADVVLCSRPGVRDGRFTGDIAVPMIGGAKAAAIRTEAAARDVDLAESYAYGDHVSDLPMLELVGHPVVVGDDPQLVRYVARRGGTRLPATTDPAKPAQHPTSARHAGRRNS